MFLISGPDLVIEACRAGIVGAFPTVNARTVEDLDAWMSGSRVRCASSRGPPRRHDRTVGGEPDHAFDNQRLPQDLELVARYQPPVVITALGSPKPAIELVHGTAAS